MEEVETEEVDIIITLKKRPFTTMSKDEQIQIYKNGRPTPSLDLKKKHLKFTRYFKTSIYRLPWVAGSVTLKKLFCWDCLLMPQNKNPWNTVGYSDLNNLPNAVKKHEQSQNHLDAVLALQIYGSNWGKIRPQILSKEDAMVHNKKVNTNRGIFRRLIDITCFLASQEHLVRGQSESISENFHECVSLLLEYDSLFGSNIGVGGKSVPILDMCDKIQDDLLVSISSLMIKIIKKQIEEADFVALLIDETLDRTGSEQLCFILRYCIGTSVVDRFLGFIDVKPNYDTEAISETILSSIKFFECSSKLIAQTYDGASAMLATRHDVGEDIRLHCPYALNMWCSGHMLNAILSKLSSHSVPETRGFFCIVKSMSEFFGKTKKLTEFYDDLCEREITQVTLTRWDNKSQIVNIIAKERQNLISIFEEIQDNPQDWDGETLSASLSFMNSLQDFEFMFLLRTFEQIFAQTETLHKVIEKNISDVEYCVTTIQHLETFIKNVSFNSIYNNTIAQVKGPKKAKAYYKEIFEKIISNIKGEINYRYAGINYLTFLKLLDSDYFQEFSREFPEELFSNLQVFYRPFFNFENLKIELISLYSSEEFTGKNVPEILVLCFLKQKDVIFPGVLKLASLFVTYPASRTTNDPSFSGLKNIHAHLQKTENQTRKSELSLIAIEREILLELRQLGTFYRDIMQEFNEHNQEIQLEYVGTE